MEKRLGEGGVGSVYAAVHQRTAARVAIKILHEEHAREPEIVARFLSEGRAANLVGHPGAVAILEGRSSEHHRTRERSASQWRG
ncbi:MAG: hypothetical protein JNK04_13475 [Myxococcales bacterium]|nr:hypothetical protein [Myxococcales bacterium]